MLLMIVTLGFWLTDSLHHISAAWIGLAAAVFLLMPGVGLISTKSFNNNISVSPLLVVAGILSIAGLINYSQLSTVVGGRLIEWLPLAPGQDLGNFLMLSMTAMLTAIIATLGGVPAALTPLAEQFSQATGFSLEAVLMTQVFGFSTVTFPYQSVPLLMAMPLAGVSLTHAARLCLYLAVLTVLILLPLDYLWWKALGWI